MVGTEVKVILVALAGAGGALGRYGLGWAIGVATFPWVTLAINLTGSYLLGLVLVMRPARGWSETVILAITVGFLGAFTTFSTFSYEAFTLVRTDRVATAATYATGSLIGGLAAAAGGYLTGRALA